MLIFINIFNCIYIMISRINQLFPSLQLGFLNPNSSIQKVEGQEGRRSSSTLAKTMVISAMLFGSFMAGTQFHRLNSDYKETKDSSISSELQQSAMSLQETIISLNGNRTIYVPDFTRIPRHLLRVDEFINIYQHCLQRQEPDWDMKCIPIEGNFVNGRLNGDMNKVTIRNGLNEKGKFEEGWLVNGTRTYEGLESDTLEQIGRFDQGKFIEGEGIRRRYSSGEPVSIEKGTFHNYEWLDGPNCTRTRFDSPYHSFFEIGEFANTILVRGIKREIKEKIAGTEETVWEGEFGICGLESILDRKIRIELQELINGTLKAADGKIYQVHCENEKIKKNLMNPNLFDWLGSFFRRKS